MRLVALHALFWSWCCNIILFLLGGGLVIMYIHWPRVKYLPANHITQHWPFTDQDFTLGAGFTQRTLLHNGRYYNCCPPQWDCNWFFIRNKQFNTLQIISNSTILKVKFESVWKKDISQKYYEYHILLKYYASINLKSHLQ